MTINPKQLVGILKVPSSCVPATVLAEVAVGMFEGGIKYGRHNYRITPIRASDYYDAARRHEDAWWEGEDMDPDSDLSHVTKAICTLIVLRDAMIQGTFIDDRPPPSPKGWLQALNDKVKALLIKYPDPKRPFTAADAPPRGGASAPQLTQPPTPADVAVAPIESEMLGTVICNHEAYAVRSTTLGSYCAGCGDNLGDVQP